MSRIFIDRPILAWVIALVIMLLGGIALTSLPVENFPDIAPTQVNIRASYPGASAATLETSVTQVIEQQLTGVDGLLYFSSSSAATGGVSISATFEKGIDPDIAQVQVQNRVQQALSRLPQAVQAQGITVTKSNPDFLMIVGIYDTTDRSSNIDVSDWMIANLQDPLGRLKGVGDINVFGAPYAMRVWLDPGRLAGYGLMPEDVIAAIRAQNAEVAAGEIGGTPSAPGQRLDATVTAQSRLQTPEQFARIVVKAGAGGAVVHLADVARIELGAENYTSVSRVNGHPGAGMGISLSPDADLLSTELLVKAEVERQAKNFPPGYAFAYANDSSVFVRKSVRDVVETLFEAVILVVIVMFVFLQSWRATLIPGIAVPVVLLGTFAVLAVAGFTINTLTLFGMVLAIGLLVDDAIVVVENVERLMAENPGMSPHDATVQSMREISVALVAIALVLSAVFLPLAFFGGSTGVIYRQFSLTIIAAMVLSVVVALVLSPALTTTILKRPEDEDHTSLIGRASFAMRIWFERNFAKLQNWYHGHAARLVARRWLGLGIFAGVLVLLAVLFVRLPTGFLPAEDQGFAQISYTLPPGATLERTRAAQLAIERYYQTAEAKNIAAYVTVAGAGAGGGASGQNAGRGFMAFKPWEERTGKGQTAAEIAQRATRALTAGYRDLEFFALVPAVVRGLGQSGGFTGELQNTSNLARADFVALRERVLKAARADPTLANVRLSSLPDQPSLKVDTNADALAAFGLAQGSVNATLATAWGGSYVNDFVDRGRVKRVFVQGDAPYRAAPENLSQWQVRGSGGQMVPFSSFARIGWTNAPTSLSRFNGISNFEFSGQAAPGKSSGQAMAAFEKIVSAEKGVSLSWAGASYQERLSSGQGPVLYAIAIIVVFLCLAGLYESWTVPVAVLLVIPVGLAGAVLATTLRGLENNVYLQIGLITTMGLTAKNAILMIEFAEADVRAGKGVVEAAMHAARIRLRPILMTSAAFIMGVLPLALATGAGANSRIAIGTSVIGGMLAATLLAVFFIPLFFVLVRGGWRRKPAAEPVA